MSVGFWSFSQGQPGLPRRLLQPASGGRSEWTKSAGQASRARYYSWSCSCCRTEVCCGNGWVPQDWPPYGWRRPAAHPAGPRKSSLLGGRAASFEVSGVPGRASGPEGVAKANELCRLTARSWDFCCECSIVVIIENPYRSLLWRCIAVEHILRSEQAIVVQCDFCIMGGSK